MVNLFEIARLAGHGTGMEALSRQFGLDPTQTTRAVEALLPAFALALQRSVLDPTVFAELTRAIGSGRYASFYEAGPGRANEGSVSGEPLLGMLFRDPDAARQVAAQAAAMTGVGTQVMNRMMPILAGTLIGGLSRYATLEGFADLLRQWSEALVVASRSYQAAAAASRPAPPPPPPTMPLDPWSAWLALANTMTGAAAPPVPPPPPAAKAPVPSANPFDAVSQMFETGREVQAQYLANLNAILDGAWRGTRSGR